MSFRLHFNVVLKSVCNLHVRTFYLRCLFQIPQYIHNQHSLLGFVYLGCKQRRLGGVLVHGVAHDVVGVAGEALHGRVVQLGRVLQSIVAL